ncbi:DUF6384 family protein [Pseudomonas citronellolis]|uniref:DUF6384 family protein n=1 Tax=Pseudomonas citronellolis TaxID=53408 RepID=UPI0021C1CD1F|nr:DUF6384 family protein [Pseudomonas citronellolis]UXJ52464.1 DUF6384 family protein [Pseudomonas citronellolis]
MVQVTLREQMGAMAVVDELRHRQMQTLELLDIGERREEVARRIREYYQGQGIQCADEVIEQGVQQYFAGRLRYASPRLKPLTGLLATIYSTHPKWFPVYGRWAFKGVLLGLGIWLSLALWQSINVGKVQQMADQLLQQQSQLASQAGDQAQRIEMLAERNTSSEPIQRLLQRPQADLEKLNAQLSTGIPSKVTRSTYKEDREAIETARTRMNESQTLLAGIVTDLSETADLQSTLETLQTIRTRDSYQPLIREYPAIPKALEAAQHAAETADHGSVATAISLTRDTLDKIRAAAAMRPYSAKLDELTKDFQRLRLPARDQSIVNARLKAFAAQIQSLNTSELADTQMDLEQLLDFAKSPLELRIVDRTGEKSGAERTYDDSGGRSWYLIAEAVDASGEAYAVPVTDSESGDFGMATVFGVRVSKVEYDKVKADKQDDGHIGKRTLGNKAANSLALRFGSRVSANPDMILSW